MDRRGKFFENNVVAIDWSDWKHGDRYHNIEVFRGQLY
jgi:hypothetical protein